MLSSRKINKVAVLGSGVMGSRIALHFANIGVKTLLLDIVPRDLADADKNNTKAKNKIVDTALETTLKSKPSAVYSKNVAKLVTTGNFDDNMKDIADADWIIEVVVENLEIKKKVFDQVDTYRKKGSIITSNTSGIQIESMIEGRSDDFKSHFCGSHFFNPPRYLRLLEIIPSSQTKAEVIDFLMHYGDLYLGKTTVLCKDTPAFIANRIGVFSIMTIFHLMKEANLSIEEIDALTGPVAGRPKSATFRTCDVVGLDTLVKVAQNAYKDCVNDESRNMFQIPDFVSKMVENNWLGDKTGQGFYKKNKTEKGKSIDVLNVNTLEYAPSKKAKFSCIEAAKPIDDLKLKIKTLHSTPDKGSAFLNKVSSYISEYVSYRIPEIADELYRLDDAVKAGFGWELGPFEQWDVLGVETFIKEMEKHGKKPAAWVIEMLAAGNTSFYKIENGIKKYYDASTKSYKPTPGGQSFIILDNLRNNTPVWKNSGATLHDIGDGVLNLEFHTKMNSIGTEVLEGIQKSIQIAEDKGWKGLVLANEGANFSAGANLAMVFMLAMEQEYDELDFAIRAFQNSTMRLRYSSIPVVSAPHNLTLGGGCEINLHADAVQASAETYIGLVEVGVGVIPGGGGTKELALRASDTFKEGDVQLNVLIDKFKQIATAQVATSAQEAFDMGLFRKGIDSISYNPSRRIADAKRKVISLFENGYTRPMERKDITVLGKTGLGALFAGAEALKLGGYASEHDIKIAKKIAWVMCGGDLSTSQQVTEQYLLDLEREAFLSLLGEKKSLERIQSILTSGKPLRN
jgi:3-hydroxyacyl-CoA dehydrogenase